MQLETTVSKLRFSVANHVRIEDRFQDYYKNTFKKWHKVNIRNTKKIYNFIKHSDEKKTIGIFFL